MLIPGQKINLRDPKLSDTELITKYLQNKQILNNTMMPNPYKLKHALWFVRRCVYERTKLKSSVHAIVNNETDKIIGMIGLHNIDPRHKHAELGYWLAKPFCQRTQRP